MNHLDGLRPGYRLDLVIVVIYEQWVIRVVSSIPVVDLGYHHIDLFQQRSRRLERWAVQSLSVGQVHWCHCTSAVDAGSSRCLFDVQYRFYVARDASSETCKASLTVMLYRHLRTSDGPSLFDRPGCIMRKQVWTRQRITRLAETLSSWGGQNAESAQDFPLTTR